MRRPPPKSRRPAHTPRLCLTMQTEAEIDTEPTDPPAATSHMGGHFDHAYTAPGTGAFGFQQWAQP